MAHSCGFASFQSPLSRANPRCPSAQSSSKEVFLKASWGNGAAFCPSTTSRKVPCLKSHNSVNTRAASSQRGPAPEDGQEEKEPSVLVKICGLTRPEDAAVAAQSGASFAGMILWPKARRFVEGATARRIVEAARQGGAEPVGVFVDESAEEIVRVCAELGISVAQLHGDAARAAFESLPPTLTTVYVAHVDPSGRIVTQLPGAQAETVVEEKRIPDWLLLDGLQGGSGVTIDWEKLKVPEGCYKQGWMLAGGLTPENVGNAVSMLMPSAVDVSSGVCGPDKLSKDHDRIRAFVSGAKGIAAHLTA